MSYLGIDPGTSRWGFVFLKGGKIEYEEAIPTENIIKKPETVIGMIERAELAVAPWAMGLS